MTRDDELPMERRESSDETVCSAGARDDGPQSELPSSDDLALEIDRLSDRILSELRSLNAYLETRL